MDMLSTAMNILVDTMKTERGWRHYRVQGKPMMSVHPDIRVEMHLSTLTFRKLNVSTSKKFNEPKIIQQLKKFFFS